VLAFGRLEWLRLHTKVMTCRLASSAVFSPKQRDAARMFYLVVAHYS
jgi:hypothetical protein